MKSIALALGVSLLASAAGAADLNPVLQNNAIAWRGSVIDGKLRPVQIKDKLNGQTLSLKGDSFQVILGEGQFVRSSDFAPVRPPRLETLPPEPASPVMARHFAGRQWVAELNAPDRNLSAEWRVMLRDGSSYVRQQLTLRALDKDVLVKEIVLFDEAVSPAAFTLRNGDDAPSFAPKTIGTVDGSPVVAGTFFFGYEHPMARNRVTEGARVRCAFARNAVLTAGESLQQSCVIGVVPRGQLRRGFLNYIERERAHPYRPFLHYNSWYDIAWEDRKFNEAESIDAISQFCQELVQKRGVHLASFLFDDGWDDNRTLWNFNSGFPNGFTPLRAAATACGAEIGVWLSPFGGYAEARQQRLKYASQFGFETNASGFSLAGPKYYARFHDICLEMIDKFGVNQFKFDGLAAGAKASASGLTRDGDAMLRLLADLRAAKPDIYINQTTGTWPSPYWLLYVDSTWRGGGDHGFRGKGPARQQWMTYRDSNTYRNVVKGGPLYPLNSLMLHGIIYAVHANRLDKTDDQDFTDEVREYFGTGTQLQEMYVTPKLLNSRNWDDLAQAARWSWQNRDVLQDTHWIGGDPASGQVYGFASWSPHKAILVLRNPADQPASFAADAANVFELPAGARKTFQLRSPWPQDRQTPAVQLRAGRPHTFSLQPFEVLILESP
jgi:hypothetical protein